ncbi:hypothetical protein HDU76_004398 [Blyttiomyces sp. JEL0837]|nr:hypothetical protein HDU76_004398 [Blyttiomyces sp. JEL0837]
MYSTFDRIVRNRMASNKDEEEGSPIDRMVMTRLFVFQPNVTVNGQTSNESGNVDQKVAPVGYGEREDIDVDLVIPDGFEIVPEDCDIVDADNAQYGVDEVEDVGNVHTPILEKSSVDEPLASSVATAGSSKYPPLPPAAQPQPASPPTTTVLRNSVLIREPSPIDTETTTTPASRPTTSRRHSAIASTRPSQPLPPPPPPASHQTPTYPRSKRSSTAPSTTPSSRKSTHDLPFDVPTTGSPTCAICISDFEPGDILRELKCRHCFHVKCVDRWVNGDRNGGEEDEEEVEVGDVEPDNVVTGNVDATTGNDNNDTPTTQPEEPTTRSRRLSLISIMNRDRNRNQSITRGRGRLRILHDRVFRLAASVDGGMRSERVEEEIQWDPLNERRRRCPLCSEDLFSVTVAESGVGDISQGGEGIVGSGSGSGAGMAL